VPNNHPDYERTFQRIATILDVIVETQNRQAAAQERLDTTVGRIADAHERLDTTVGRIADAHERLDATVGRIADAIERLTLKSIETEDKLNGLIDLMNRHVAEDHGGTR
jgi:ABC-type transporter Mla subunit MlaD